LVHKYRMFDDAEKARVTYYKAVNDKKGKGHGFGKLYNKDKGKKKDVGRGSKVNVVEVKCFKCATLGHFANDCRKRESCYKCGQKGHKVYECKRDITCYNCIEPGYLSSKCTKPKWSSQNISSKVCVLSITLL